MAVTFKRGPASNNSWTGEGTEPELFYKTARKEIFFQSTVSVPGLGFSKCKTTIDSESFEWVVRNMLSADPEKFEEIVGAMMQEDFQKTIEAFESVKQWRIDRAKERLERHRAWEAKRAGQPA